MFWLVLDLLRGPAAVAGSGPLRRFALLLVGLVLITITSGGFVAGLKAGFTYNTFPLMNGQLVPDGLLLMEPAWRNATENITTVQFNHRLLAIGLAVAAVVFWWQSLKHERAGVRVAGHLTLAAAAAQVALGIATLVLVVPISLAAAHQAGAVLLLTAVLNAAHGLRAG